MFFHRSGLIKLAMVGMAGLLAFPTFASTHKAWLEHDLKVAQKCAAASDLINAVVSSKPIIFDDSVGYTAVTVRGHLKPRASSPAKATAIQEKLCLYMRQTHQVYIAPILPATR